jgi:glycine/D-amino acid oxidase-like deaminating enzyme
MADLNYVIVGAGTTGCMLASRLSEDPGNRVLVLEYGGHETNPMLYVQEGSISRCGAAAIATITRPGRSVPGGQVGASLPVQVAGNTQAPAMAVAWIVAGLILEGS